MKNKGRKNRSTNFNKTSRTSEVNHQDKPAAHRDQHGTISVSAGQQGPSQESLCAASNNDGPANNNSLQTAATADTKERSAQRPHTMNFSKSTVASRNKLNKQVKRSTSAGPDTHPATPPTPQRATARKWLRSPVRGFRSYQSQPRMLGVAKSSDNDVSKTQADLSPLGGPRGRSFTKQKQPVASKQVQDVLTSKQDTAPAAHTTDHHGYQEGRGRGGGKKTEDKSHADSETRHHQVRSYESESKAISTHGPRNRLLWDDSTPRASSLGRVRFTRMRKSERKMGMLNSSWMEELSNTGHGSSGKYHGFDADMVGGRTYEESGDTKKSRHDKKVRDETHKSKHKSRGPGEVTPKRTSKFLDCNTTDAKDLSNGTTHGERRGSSVDCKLISSDRNPTEAEKKRREEKINPETNKALSLAERRDEVDKVSEYSSTSTETIQAMGTESEGVSKNKSVTDMTTPKGNVTEQTSPCYSNTKSIHLRNNNIHSGAFDSQDVSCANKESNMTFGGPNISQKTLANFDLNERVRILTEYQSQLSRHMCGLMSELDGMLASLKPELSKKEQCKDRGIRGDNTLCFNQCKYKQPTDNCHTFYRPETVRGSITPATVDLQSGSNYCCNSTCRRVQTLCNHCCCAKLNSFGKVHGLVEEFEKKVTEDHHVVNVCNRDDRQLVCCCQLRKGEDKCVDGNTIFSNDNNGDRINTGDKQIFDSNPKEKSNNTVLSELKQVCHKHCTNDVACLTEPIETILKQVCCKDCTNDVACLTEPIESINKYLENFERAPTTHSPVLNSSLYLSNPLVPLQELIRRLCGITDGTTFLQQSLTGNKPATPGSDALLGNNTNTAGATSNSPGGDSVLSTPSGDPVCWKSGVFGDTPSVDKVQPHTLACVGLLGTLIEEMNMLKKELGIPISNGVNNSLQTLHSTHVINKPIENEEFNSQTETRENNTDQRQSNYNIENIPELQETKRSYTDRKLASPSPTLPQHQSPINVKIQPPVPIICQSFVSNNAIQPPGPICYTSSPSSTSIHPILPTNITPSSSTTTTRPSTPIKRSISRLSCAQPRSRKRRLLARTALGRNYSCNVHYVSKEGSPSISNRMDLGDKLSSSKHGSPKLSNRMDMGDKISTSKQGSPNVSNRIDFGNKLSSSKQGSPNLSNRMDQGDKISTSKQSGDATAKDHHRESFESYQCGVQTSAVLEPAPPQNRFYSLSNPQTRSLCGQFVLLLLAGVAQMLLQVALSYMQA